MHLHNANDRLHTFILEGVPDTRAARCGARHRVRVLSAADARIANDIVYDLAAQAAAVVTDDYPTFIAAAHNARVPEKIDVAYFAVDSSCIVPMNRFTKREYAAYTIRPKITEDAAGVSAAGSGTAARSGRGRADARVSCRSHCGERWPDLWRPARSITPCRPRPAFMAAARAAQEPLWTSFFETV